MILNVSSVAGKMGWANASAYCASKFGLAGFSQALLDEGRAHGIRDVVLYPGAMATSWGARLPEERHEMERGRPAGPGAAPGGDSGVYLGSPPPRRVSC